jgi:hypothetical protein
LTVADFGLCLALAAALEAVRQRLGRRGGAALLAAVAAAMIAGRGANLARVPMWNVPSLTRHAPVYDAVATTWSAEGRGPLLELPLSGRWPDDVQPRERTFEPDSILASTRHWWPTPAAHLSYHADHRRVFLQLASSIDDPRALEDMIDLTHVRWLLLRPRSQWHPPERHDRAIAALRGSPAIGELRSVDDWLLARIDRAPQHEAWFRTVAGGDAPGRTVFGTPLAPMPAGAARGSVRLAAEDLGPQRTPRKLSLPLTLSNTGSATWPATPVPRRTLSLQFGLWAPGPLQHLVMLASRWRRLEPDPRPFPAEPSARAPVRRDVDPGETISDQVTIAIPAESGLYELEVRLEQVEEAAFDPPESEALRLRVRVEGRYARILDATESASGAVR